MRGIGGACARRACLLALALVACDGPRPASHGSGLESSDAGNALKAPEAGNSVSSDSGARREEPEDGSADSGDARFDAGDAGMEPDVCGDGVRGLSEFCDGDDLHGASCESFGYTSGALACNAECRFDFSGCTGVEICYDGIDNDGDSLRDCSDPDCAAACANSCAAPTTIPADSLIDGDTTGKPALLGSSCVPHGTTSGSELVFRVVPEHTGVLAATLTAVRADFTLSVRSTCADDASELTCSNVGAGAGAMESVAARVTAGQEVFLVVDGAGLNEAGAFALQTTTRPSVCGDGIRDPGEQCDDGNTKSGDGCSPSCSLEIDESEPNDSVASANAYTEPSVVGEISSAADVDVFSFAVDHANSTLLAETLDLGDGSCANLTLDDRIEILTADGTVVASDDDGGEGFCATASATGLAQGTYYVRVSASGFAKVFPYRLRLSVSP